jgi:hypothetical protein
VGLSFGVVNEYLPVANVYRSLIRMFVEGSYGFLGVDMMVIGAFAVVFTVISPIIADKVAEVDFSARIERIRQRRKKKSSHA